MTNNNYPKDWKNGYPVPQSDKWIYRRFHEPLEKAWEQGTGHDFGFGRGQKAL